MTTLQFAIILSCTLCFGLIIGAYYGTIEYRIRNDLPLITKDCFCPSCGQILPLSHQIPVISWILLRGKCGFCHTSISIRYPLFESIFALFYPVTLVLLDRHLAFLLPLWFGFITIMLTIRSKGHFLSLFKGLGIMYLYHFLYGILLCIIFAPV